jgi:outer membrane protein W
MNFSPHKKVVILTFLITCFFQVSFSQDEQNKWVLGAGFNAVDFFPTGEPSEFTGNNGGFFSGISNAKDHWNVSAPSINITRHLKNRFSADVSISINNITKVGAFETKSLSYFSVDTSLQYSILDNSSKFSPYAFVGGGYTWINSKGWGTFNAGLGTNYWFSNKFGAKLNMAYKHSGDKKHRVLSHFQYSFGLIVKLNTNSKFVCN